MFVKDVRIGDTVEFDHERHGMLGSMRIESKTGNVVRLIFNMPRDIIIRAIERAAHKSCGLGGGKPTSFENSSLQRASV